MKLLKEGVANNIKDYTIMQVYDTWWNDTDVIFLRGFPYMLEDVLNVYKEFGKVWGPLQTDTDGFVKKLKSLPKEEVDSFIDYIEETQIPFNVYNDLEKRYVVDDVLGTLKEDEYNTNSWKDVYTLVRLRELDSNKYEYAFLYGAYKDYSKPRVAKMTGNETSITDLKNWVMRTLKFTLSSRSKNMSKESIASYKKILDFLKREEI